MKEKINAATIYLEKARGIQTKEKRHRTLSNLITKGKLREAIQFLCEQGKGEFETRKIGRVLYRHYQQNHCISLGG